MDIYKEICLMVIIMVLLSNPLSAQQRTITGTVTDRETEEVLPGVNILVIGTSLGAVTNADGYYELEVSAEADTLQFSYIGYESQSIAIQGRSTINVELVPQTYRGDEVVVVGYGEQSNETLTSSVTSVSGEDIAKVPATNIGNALFGTSGLQMEQSTGQPGVDQPRIFIRGRGSLNSDQPLFVLDGVVVQSGRSIMQLDPDNIESISVLKDASATAVYGVEGANGVIVVKTKRGRRGEMEISVNTSTGVNMPTVRRDYVNSYTWAKAHNQAQINDGVNAENVDYTPEMLEAYRTGSDPIIYPNSDWVDLFLKPAAFQSRTNISVSGGTDDVRYYISGGYLKQDGFLRDFDTEAVYDDYDNNPTYDRYNLRSNLDIDVTPSTQLSLNATGRVSSAVELGGFGAASNGEQWWKVLYWSPPHRHPGIVDGKVVMNGNRYIPSNINRSIQGIFSQGYRENIRNTLNLQLSITQKLDAIINGLQLQLKGAYNSRYNELKEFSMRQPVYEPYYRTDVDPTAPGDSTVVFRTFVDDNALSYSQSHGNDRDWYLEARLQYNGDFGRHGVKGLLLAGQRRRYYPGQYTGIPRQLINTVGRINYNYDDRYLLEMSMGYNGSENFAEGNRFGFFPAVSGGWIITNEPYMPELSFLNFLKLRASYGIVGNDKGVGRFLYLPDEYDASCGGYNFGYEVPQNQTGACEGALGHPGVTWEKVRKQNYGIDMRMFGDRLDLSLDYFYNFRYDILTTLNTVPSYVAADFPAANIGQMENKGYEAKITWRQQVGDFFFSIGGTVSHARNKIIEMDEIPRNEPYQRRTGHPLGQQFGYVFDGYYTEQDITNLDNGVLPKPTWTVKPGYLKYKDLNGDGIVDEDDTKAIGYVRELPEYMFGSTLNFSYRNVNLSMTWAAATNTSVVFERAPLVRPIRQGANGAERALMQWQWDGRWTPDKDPEDVLFPILSLAAHADRNDNKSSFWVKDASYLRLKSLEIGYTFSSFAETLGIRNMRVYLNAYNPLTFSNLLDTYDVDPEQKGKQNEQVYPVSEVYTAGLKLDF